MDVSINYPWGTHIDGDTQRSSAGFDFGDTPSGHGVQSTLDGRERYCGYWTLHLAEDLRTFADIGIKTVRFAILLNGITYGIGREAPSRPDPGSHWRFAPVPLSPKFLDDFRLLVRTFGAFTAHGLPRVTLLPVITGFDFAVDPRVNNHAIPHDLDPWQPQRNAFSHFIHRPSGMLYSAGKRYQSFSRAALPPESRDRFHAELGEQHREPTYQDSFIYYVLERLLDEFRPGGALEAHRRVIRCWEVCGEPEMCCTEPDRPVSPPSFWPGEARQPVAYADMLSYLDKALYRVEERGFRSTVGFQKVASWRSWGHQVQGDLGQFHYYADQALPPVQPGEPAILGEVATAADSNFDPAFTGLLGRRPRTLQERLEWFEYRGYREVFLWSAERRRPGGLQSWGDAERTQVRAFTSGLRTLALAGRQVSWSE